MPLPTTAVETEMMLEAFRAQVARGLLPYQRALADFVLRVFEREIFPQPHTGDMVQMLDDLGIEVSPRPAPTTFRWRNR